MMADFLLNDIPDLSPRALGLPDDAKEKVICVGLSGGVDSSVAAMLLKSAGYNVFALFMQNWHDTEGTLHGECEWEEDRSVAQMVARKIGIPFHFIDLSDVYRKQVIDYMFEEYSRGRTPNPDVMCNSKIKFAAFLKAAQDLGADYVATGHYCRKAVTDGKNPCYQLLAGTDPNKDQSYFLCQLTQEQLSKAVFPIGDIIKPEVRRLAREGGLPSAEKKDSQGICFVGKVDLPVFLQQKLKSRKGNVVEIFPSFYDTLPGYPGYGRGLSVTEEEHKAGEDIILHIASGNNDSDGRYSDTELEALASTYHYSPSDGKVIGEHIGAQYFTIGQRKGLNIGGHKDHIFIISIDMESNTIFVGEGHHHPGLLRKALAISSDEIHWIRPDLEMKDGEQRQYLVRVRYRQPLQRAVLYMRKDALFILFDEHQRGVSSGQFASWYTPDGELIGSGIIK